MEESILTSVKQQIGIGGEDCTHYDSDIITHINTIFVILNHMGVGTEKCFHISDKETKWSEFTQGDPMIESVKSYMALKVRMLFDPPTSSILKEAIESNIRELEWRLYEVSDKSTGG